MLADWLALVEADLDALVLADWLALVDADLDALVLADWLALVDAEAEAEVDRASESDTGTSTVFDVPSL